MLGRIVESSPSVQGTYYYYSSSERLHDALLGTAGASGNWEPVSRCEDNPCNPGRPAQQVGRRPPW